MYSLSPFKLARHCWLPSRSIFGKRTRASINRTSHPHSKGLDDHLIRERVRERERKVTEFLLAVHHLSQEQTLARLFFLVLFIIISPRRQSTNHTGVGYYTTTVARTSINLVSLVQFF